MAGKYTPPDKLTVMIRDFPADIWKKARIEAVERGINLKSVMIEALTLWLKREGE